MSVDALPQELTTVKIRVTPHVLFRQVAAELVMLDLKRKTYYGLNEVGTRMWDRLSNSATVAAALQELAQEFEVDPVTLEEDLRELVNKLAAKNMLQIEPAA